MATAQEIIQKKILEIVRVKMFREYSLGWFKGYIIVHQPFDGVVPEKGFPLWLIPSYFGKTCKVVNRGPYGPHFRCSKCGEKWNSYTGAKPCLKGGQCNIPILRNRD